MINNSKNVYTDTLGVLKFETFVIGRNEKCY